VGSTSRFCWNADCASLPFLVQAVSTIRRACPSTAADQGKSVVEHLPFIQQFVREGRLSNANIEPPDLKLGEARAWKSIELVLGTASALLSDQRFPPVRRLVHALQFANLFIKPKRKKWMSESSQSLCGYCRRWYQRNRNRFLQNVVHLAPLQTSCSARWPSSFRGFIPGLSQCRVGRNAWNWPIAWTAFANTLVQRRPGATGRVVHTLMRRSQ